MAEGNWKDTLDPVLRGHLEHQLREVAKQKRSYMEAPNSNFAQIWCSVAILSKQIFSLNARLKEMEMRIESMTQSKAIAPKTTKRATRRRK